MVKWKTPRAANRLEFDASVRYGLVVITPSPMRGSMIIDLGALSDSELVITEDEGVMRYKRLEVRV